MIFYEEKKPNIFIRSWWKIETFVENWIYPAYYLTNFLFHKYNRITLPMYKSYEYVETMDKMKYANFELIKYFIEQEQPEKNIQWYGNEGHKYGDYKLSVKLYPELTNTYIMDIIKKIYKFYTEELPQLNKEYEYLSEIWYEYLYNCHTEEDPENKDLFILVNNPITITLEDLEQKNLDWNIITKYISKEELLKEDALRHKINDLEVKIENTIQYYLHLCIEVRPYLWV